MSFVVPPVPYALFPVTSLHDYRPTQNPHLRKLGGQAGRLGEYMKDAQLMIQKPSLMVSAVNMIDALPLTAGDTKGDLYEYLLSKLTTAGINGQFRTPRHMIRLMVDLLEPQPTDIIGDPACGTGGFLVGVIENLRQRYTSEAGKLLEDGLPSPSRQEKAQTNVGNLDKRCHAQGRPRPYRFVDRVAKTTTSAKVAMRTGGAPPLSLLHSMLQRQDTKNRRIP
ncbi:MAG TPA: N-6 DNA methylase [Pirellulales bacterium]